MLPRISPEALYFAAWQREVPRRGLDLADGTVVVMCGQAIYAMPAEDWAMFEELMKSPM